MVPETCAGHGAQPSATTPTTGALISLLSLSLAYKHPECPKVPNKIGTMTQPTGNLPLIPFPCTHRIFVGTCSVNAAAGVPSSSEYAKHPMRSNLKSRTNCAQGGSVGHNAQARGRIGMSG